MLLWVKPGACPVRDARKTHIHVGEDTSTLLEKRTAKVLYFDIFFNVKSYVTMSPSIFAMVIQFVMTLL